MKYIFALLLLLLITLFALVAAPAIGMYLISVAYGIPFMEFTSQMQNMTAYPEIRTPVLLLQGFTQLFSFFGVALFFTKYVYKFNQANPNNGTLSVMDSNLAQQFLEEPFLKTYKTPALVFLVVIGLAIVTFPAVQLAAALNGAVEFPEFLKGLEMWMKEKETSAETLTLFMTNFSSPSQVVLGFVVIAIIAGLAEEVFFRGVIQPIFQNLTNNKHTAIWITAAIFSAIHFQFYGFIPRMLLGALFGYLYLYTNNITVPIWAHILNNGFSLIGFLFIDKEILNSPKMEGNDFMIMLPLGILSVVLCIGILKFIKKTMEKEVEQNLK